MLPRRRLTPGWPLASGRRRAASIPATRPGHLFHVTEDSLLEPFALSPLFEKRAARRRVLYPSPSCRSLLWLSQDTPRRQLLILPPAGLQGQTLIMCRRNGSSINRRLSSQLYGYVSAGPAVLKQSYLQECHVQIDIERTGAPSRQFSIGVGAAGNAHQKLVPMYYY
jgi:hypothetical protein